MSTAAAKRIAEKLGDAQVGYELAGTGECRDFYAHLEEVVDEELEEERSVFKGLCNTVRLLRRRLKYYAPPPAAGSDPWPCDVRSALDRAKRVLVRAQRVIKDD